MHIFFFFSQKSYVYNHFPTSFLHLTASHESLPQHLTETILLFSRVCNNLGTENERNPTIYLNDAAIVNCGRRETVPVT